MLQNKIYQNFSTEIIKTFLMILFGLSLIALTVRAVNFLDLVVDNGYSVSTYLKYSFINLFSIAPKFIPLSFLLALSIFIIKHLHDSEFVILWTSGVKKIQIVNLFFSISIAVLIFYLILSTIITPFALNKSRQLLGADNVNSFLPTIKSQRFSDSFKGLTVIVEKKINNQLENIFLHDKSNNLKGLSSNTSDQSTTTIIAKNGIVKKNVMLLLNGQIISTRKNSDSEIIKFDQLNIDLSNLTTTTIKKPKIQERSTLILLSCFIERNKKEFCTEEYKKEIISTLNRRMTIPFYLPVLSLICSLLLIKSKEKFFNKISIFFYGFLILLFTELAVRYTGIRKPILTVFIILPFIMFSSLYMFLIYKFTKEASIK